jgi:endonuclease/exonuclease/phosphatase family metal-dependent hydrolase
VATYNVHACIGADRRHDPDRIAAVIHELDADVVALQEFTYPASVAIDTRTPVVLMTLDRYQCALGPTRERRGRTVTECFGNALLSRLPILEVRRLDLSMTSREPRGALAATVDLGGGTHLHVLAAHLGLRLRERRFQVTQILTYLGSVSNELVVVLGDFNDWLPGRSAAHVLDALLGRPPQPASFPVSWPFAPLDRVWVRPRSALLRVAAHRSQIARIASDHLPIVAEIDRGGGRAARGAPRRRFPGASMRQVD